MVKYGIFNFTIFRVLYHLIFGKITNIKPKRGSKKMEHDTNTLMHQAVSPASLKEYASYLHEQERSSNTIEKYIRDLRAFFLFLSGKEIDKAAVLGWKESLAESHRPASINSMLAAVNGYLDFCGLALCKVKPVKMQRKIFLKAEKVLTREEYICLVRAAESKGNRRLSLLVQSICATGIRVSELKYLTVNSLYTGRAEVDCKGKIRVVFLTKELCRALRCYCRENNITRGPIFCTRDGRPLNRNNIWRDMKSLCRSAGVEPGKVFPHNLRHLFARTYYSMEKDLSRLADLLGHANISTTRIYTMDSGEEHAKQLDLMHLVLSVT